MSSFDPHAFDPEVFDPNSFDPMAAAIDWLEAYRSASLAIVDMYAERCLLECVCNGSTAVHGRAAITEYWQRRFTEKPAGELIDLQPQGDDVVITYRVPDGAVQAVLQFDDHGKVRRSRCSPAVLLRR